MVSAESIRGKTVVYYLELCNVRIYEPENLKNMETFEKIFKAIS
jgi:hypothetical protein